MRYLEIIYGDNDFGLLVENALRRLYKWVYDSNAHCIAQRKQDKHFSNRSIPQMFRELHRHGILKQMIVQLIDSENIAMDVEFATRGLYWKTMDWSRHKIKNKMTYKSLCNDCLSLTLRFHIKDTFRQKWQNGEHAYLDLKTGECDTF